MEIDIQNHQRKFTFPGARLRRMVKDLTLRLKLTPQSLSLVFIGERRMRSLNRRYRGVDRSTDVLSFDGSGLPGHLGDIVISLPNAARNARQEKHSVQKEIGWLVLHGMLHLAGYDHETDQGQMRRLEYQLRSVVSLME